MVPDFFSTLNVLSNGWLSYVQPIKSTPVPLSVLNPILETCIEPSITETTIAFAGPTLCTVAWFLILSVHFQIPLPFSLFFLSSFVISSAAIAAIFYFPASSNLAFLAPILLLFAFNNRPFFTSITRLFAVSLGSLSLAFLWPNLFSVNSLLVFPIIFSGYSNILQFSIYSDLFLFLCIIISFFFSGSSLLLPFLALLGSFSFLNFFSSFPIDKAANPKCAVCHDRHGFVASCICNLPLTPTGQRMPRRSSFALNGIASRKRSISFSEIATVFGDDSVSVLHTGDSCAKNTPVSDEDSDFCHPIRNIKPSDSMNNICEAAASESETNSFLLVTTGDNLSSFESKSEDMEFEDSNTSFECQKSLLNEQKPENNFKGDKLEKYFKDGSENNFKDGSENNFKGDKLENNFNEQKPENNFNEQKSENKFNENTIDLSSRFAKNGAYLSSPRIGRRSSLDALCSPKSMSCRRSLPGSLLSSENKENAKNV